MIQLLKKCGNLEPFEIKNSSVIFIIAGPLIYLYSLIIYFFRPDAIEIPYSRIYYGVLFVLIGLLPFLKSKKIEKTYGLFIFVGLLIFSANLFYTSFLNHFKLDYLLGAYVLVFGSLLLLSNRILIITYITIILLFVFGLCYLSDISIENKMAINVSMFTIFLFSFLILNSSLRNRSALKNLNILLEKRIEKRTRDLEFRATELAATNKDLQDFAYVVSHDLKRPVHNIYTVTQFLEEDIRSLDNQENIDQINLIKEQVKYIDLLISGILNYSLPTTEYQYENVDVSEVVENVIYDYSAENIVITKHGIFPKVIIDRMQLKEIFLNLVVNGIKHNKNSFIKIQIFYTDKEDHHLFHVLDNGPGIPKKYHEKIFKLFQKLEDQTTNYSIGMGLPLIKKIVSRNGGEIGIEQSTSEGTIFYFTLPKKVNLENINLNTPNVRVV